MSLKDRIKAKKEEKSLAGRTEYNISVGKVAGAISKMQNSEDLGNIVREFARFLSSLESKKAKIVFSGEFDIGQKTLLNCMLSSFFDENDLLDEGESITKTEDAEPKLIKKRKSLKSIIEEKQEENNE